MGYRKWLAVLVALTMIFSMIPMMAAADEHEPEPPPNFAYVPNAEEASVSKVDLVNFEEVARYSTVEPRPDEADWPDYRVSRLAMDSGGNAWALNTMTGRDWTGYSTAQGSVARISATPVGDDVTSEGSGIGAIVTNDDRVSYFNLGEEGEGPRTITIVEENEEIYLWIGFYLGNYFQKYWYDAVKDELELIENEGDIIGTIDVGDYTPYTAALVGDWMWVVSRNASPFPSPISPNPGVFRFNVSTGAIEDLEYEVPGENNPYSIMIDNDGNVWVSDAGNWGTEKDREFAVYDSDGVVSYVPVGLDVETMRGFIQDEEGTIWATTVAGEVLKGTKDNGGWEFEIAKEGLDELAGIGMDAQGYIWVVRYGDDSISRFDPDNTEDGIDETVGVGAGPYAYDNFIVEAPPTYDICGFKYLAEEGECTENGILDWEIRLYRLVEDGDVDVDADWVLVDQEGLDNPVDTDEDGKYCFTGLLAGTYKVVEEDRGGWDAVGDSYHIVVLPDEATVDPEEVPFYNFCNEPDLFCGDDTVWAAEKHPGEKRFVEQGNWGTYVMFDLDWDEFDANDPKAYPLYGGQHYLAGVLYAYAVGDTLYVKYDTELPEGWAEHCDKLFEKEGYEDVEWSGLLEYHLHVVDEFDDFNDVRTASGRNRDPGNPIPGQFEYKGSFDPAAEDSGWIAVDITDFEGKIFIAAHGVMQWCGFEEDAYNDATANGWNGNGN